jgi:hypothetical protein
MRNAERNVLGRNSDSAIVRPATHVRYRLRVLNVEEWQA